MNLSKFPKFETNIKRIIKALLAGGANREQTNIHGHPPFAYLK